MKQVNKSHYQFSKYLKKGRWISIWHQIDEVIKCNPFKVLEIGPGPGIFKHVLNNNGITVETVDIDPELEPDYVASATQLPFKDNSYDCVCAFQMLEHIPYEESLIAFKEMVRVSKKNVVISLPDVQISGYYSIYVPFIGNYRLQIITPILKKKKHVFNGEHYWEISKKGYSLKKVIADLSKNKVRLLRNFRVNENTYHHFFIFEKN
jgi:predicted SAM-dependent methyltransferase